MFDKNQKKKKKNEPVFTTIEIEIVLVQKTTTFNCYYIFNTYQLNTMAGAYTIFGKQVPAHIVCITQLNKI